MPKHKHFELFAAYPEFQTEIDVSGAATLDELMDTIRDRFRMDDVSVSRYFNGGFELRYHRSRETGVMAFNETKRLATHKRLLDTLYFRVRIPSMMGSSLRVMRALKKYGYVKQRDRRFGIHQLTVEELKHLHITLPKDTNWNDEH